MVGVPGSPIPITAQAPSCWVLSTLPRLGAISSAVFFGMSSVCCHAGWIQPVIKGRGMSQNPVSRSFPIKNNSRGAARRC